MLSLLLHLCKLNKPMKFTAIVLTLLAILMNPFDIYTQNAGFGLIVNSKYNNWETDKKLRSLPFCNQRHFDKGNSTPNPFGIGIHSFYYNQDFYGTGLELVGELEGSNAPIPTLHLRTGCSHVGPRAISPLPGCPPSGGDQHLEGSQYCFHGSRPSRV